MSIIDLENEFNALTVHTEETIKELKPEIMGMYIYINYFLKYVKFGIFY